MISLDLQGPAKVIGRTKNVFPFGITIVGDFAVALHVLFHAFMKAYTISNYKLLNQFFCLLQSVSSCLKETLINKNYDSSKFDKKRFFLVVLTESEK